MSDITREDWERILGKAWLDVEGFKSKRELEQITGLSNDVITRRLEKAIDAGLVEISKQKRVGRCGTNAPVFVYKLNKNALEAYEKQ